MECMANDERRIVKGRSGTNLLILLVGLLVLLSACQRSEPELLVAYSGDGQAYIEPCG